MICVLNMFNEIIVISLILILIKIVCNKNIITSVIYYSKIKFIV